jgi:hypothetical protein
MKRFLMASGLTCVLMIGAWAAGAPANFSGTWVLDKAKSEGLNPRMADLDVTMTVTQDDKQISTETKYSGGAQERPPQKAMFNLDGSETTAEETGRMPGKATRKAKWMGDGKILELHTVRNVSVQGNDVTITQKEHWELADGGKTLKIHRTTESPQGTQESKLTFNKKM